MRGADRPQWERENDTDQSDTGHGGAAVGDDFFQGEPDWSAMGVPARHRLHAANRPVSGKYDHRTGAGHESRYTQNAGCGVRVESIRLYRTTTTARTQQWLASMR